MRNNHYLNIHVPNEIKYRVEKRRCTIIGIENNNLIGYNYKYNQDELNEREVNIVFSIALPIGKWVVSEKQEYDTVILNRA